MMSRKWLLDFEAIRCRCCDYCPYSTITSYRAWPKEGEESEREEKNKKLTRSAIQKVSHLGWRRPAGRNEGCCEAQLSLRSTSSVERPRYTKRERRDRCWLGGQLSSLEETSLVVLNLRCQRGVEGRLQSEPTGGWLRELQSSSPIPTFLR